VTPEHRKRWELEIRRQKGTLKRPGDPLRRVVSSEDFVDSAILGGVSLADVLSGKIAEWQIPSNVIDAFHVQYPQYGASFVEAVKHLAGDSEKLMGLVNGVKGKLFEIDYAAWLNHGHLPTGMTAELAHHATNPGWDIVIRDGQGHVDQLLQLKASESIDYVHEAIAAHPGIDVVVPHEIYEKLAANPDALAHILDGHEALNHLNGQVADAIAHAEAAGAAEHFPVLGPILVIGIAAVSNFQAYRRGRTTPAEALRNVGERGALALLACAAGWATTLAAGEPFVGLPTSMVVRLFGGQILHNLHRRELMAQHLESVRDSRRQIERQLLRPLLEAGTG
jgi:hypothetical protein